MVFEDIWRIYHVELKGFIDSKITDNHMSNDILQEVGIKLHKKLEQEEKIENIKAWLYQVTRNTIADYYRKDSKQVQLDIKSFAMMADNEACVCDLSGFVIQNFLPEEYGKPLFMSDVEQIPQQEIADVLNLSLTATKSRIQRGRKKLRELVEGCVEISFNQKGQIADFKLKDGCELPQEIMAEMEKIKLVI